MSGKWHRLLPVVAVCMLVVAVLVLAMARPHAYQPPVKGQTLADMTGRRIPFNPPARRAAMFVDAAGFITVDRGPAHLVGLRDRERRALSRQPLGWMYPDVGRWPELLADRADPMTPSDPEQLLALRPDVVLAWPPHARPLEAVGFRVMHATPTATEAQTIALWRMFGRLSGQDVRAERIVAAYREARSRLAVELESGSARPVPRVLMLSMRPAGGALGGFFLSPATFVITHDIGKVGGRNAAEGFGNGHVNLEGLLRLDADLIFIPAIGTDSEPPTALLANRALQSLAAVRERRVYAMPLLDRGLVEHPLRLRWMAELMHPEAMHRELRAQLRQHYQAVYGHVLGDDDIDQALYLTENAASAGYERFRRP